MELPAYPMPHTVDEQSVIKAEKQNVTVHKGHPGMVSHNEAMYTLDFYEQLHERGIPVSSQLLAIEWQRFSPQLNQVVLQCVTHKAQNIHFEQPIIVDFTHYVNPQIVSGRYTADLIISMDETNVDFDPSPSTTLSRIGERSVNACINGNSGLCIVILACTMSMVIWKGLPNGRIDKECHGPLFAHDNIKHAVQVRGWVDSEKYQMQFREVLVPYLNG
jgi:hypothetical protein